MDISRRIFIKKVVIGTGAIAAGFSLTGCDDDNEKDNTSTAVEVAFNHGVASGDPTASAVILWTRVTPVKGVADGDLNVTLEVSASEDFTSLLASDVYPTNAARDYTVKIDLDGLSAGQTYFYRFRFGNTLSPVGQTKTLPTDNVDTVKLAVFSCANYPAGYFHVYAEAARHAADYDAVVHLGDYIYEYGAGGYATQDAETLGRVPVPPTEIITLADFRARYAQHRQDADLQALHAATPWIVVWDDHEVANDAYKNGAENHDDASEGAYSERQAAALQAYHEWLPIRTSKTNDVEDRLSIYRNFAFGNLVNLTMLDTRHIGRDKSIDIASFFTPTGLDAAGFTDALTDPNRQLLGAEQSAYVQTQLTTSSATWQVLGQQVLMGRMMIPSSILLASIDPATGATDAEGFASALSEYITVGTAAITAQTVVANLDTTTIATLSANIPGFDQLSAEEQAIALAVAAHQAELDGGALSTEQVEILTGSHATLSLNLLDPAINPPIPYNLDAWDGYAVAREVLLGTAVQAGCNLISLAGDTHNAWASNLTLQDGTPAGVEFATSSVSSPGFEEYFSLDDASAAQLEMALPFIITDLHYTNSSKRGYMTVEFTATEANAEWVFVNTIKEAEYSLLTSAGKTLKVNADSHQLVVNA